MNNSVSLGNYISGDLILSNNITTISTNSDWLIYTGIGTVTDNREERIRELEAENQKLKEEIRRYKINQEY